MSELFRFCTFNIRYNTVRDGQNAWSYRKEQVGSLLQQLQPDIFGLQECLPTQAQDLVPALSEYSFVGVSRDDGRQQGEMVPLFYRKKRFQLVHAGHFWLSETPHLPGSQSWNSALPRMATWGVFREREKQTLFWVFNTHLDHESQHARKQSLLLIKRYLDALGTHLPFVLMGDFNAIPLSPEVAPLFEQIPLQDLLAQTSGGTFHNFLGHPDGPRIDWILASTHFKLETISICRSHSQGKYPSDHFPVIAEIRLN